MKYKLVWCDSFNTFNWADDELTENKTEQDFDDIVNSGIKNLTKEYSNIVIERIDEEGWADCEIVEEFEANNFEEIKQKVEEILNNTGRIIDVFGVVDETGKEILTEEDFYG